MKVCNKCGRELDESMFYKCKKSKDGLAYDCRDCRNTYNKEYRQGVGGDKHKAYMIKYNAEHKEQIKQYYEDNKERLAVLHKKYREENKDKIEKSRKDNKDRIAEYNYKYHHTIIEKECANPNCKKKFRAERDGTKYCSDECYKENYLRLCRKTNQEKYGVDYFVLTEQYRNNKINKISNINLNFATLLSKNNIEYYFEFVLDNYSYDFYLPDYNLVIEINPTFSHSVKPNQLGWCVPDKEYHYNKTKLAKQNGYRCICIWDWDDKEAIIQAIKENTLEILNGTVINKHWNKINTKEHIQDNGQDEKQMVAEGWLPIYDDGQTLIY